MAYQDQFVHVNGLKDTLHRRRLGSDDLSARCLSGLLGRRVRAQSGALGKRPE